MRAKRASHLRFIRQRTSLADVKDLLKIELQLRTEPPKRTRQRCMMWISERKKLTATGRCLAPTQSVQPPQRRVDNLVSSKWYGDVDDLWYLLYFLFFFEASRTWYSHASSTWFVLLDAAFSIMQSRVRSSSFHRRWPNNTDHWKASITTTAAAHKTRSQIPGIWNALVDATSTRRGSRVAFMLLYE